MSSKPNKDFAFNVNSAVLKLLQEYLNTHRECTITKALKSFGLDSIDPNENTTETIFNLIKNRYIREDECNTPLSKFDIVKCPFERYGIVVAINPNNYLWGHKTLVQFIGGDATFIDSFTEQFKSEDLVLYVLNV